MRPRLALALCAAVVTVVLAAAVPVLDEESYLDIARQLDPARPYDWWRPWPPWGSAREADAYVYAHLPGFFMWVWAWVRAAGLRPDSDLVAPIKMAAGLPWAALLGWGVGRLAERVTTRPWLAAGVWLAGPVALLGLQRGLMPDLMLTSLMTLCVVGWLEASTTTGGLSRRWRVWAGAALGAAVTVKYSALVMVPVLLLHQRATRVRAGLTWLSFGLVWGAVELWLAGLYGRVHLVEVLTRAHELGHTGLGSRSLGVLARAGLLAPVVPMALLRPWRRYLLPAVGVAGLITVVGAPEGTSLGDLVGVALFALAGCLVAVVVVVEWVSAAARARDRTPHDGLLLSAWAVAVVLGVVLGHNFAAPRYLLPATVPLTLLLVRHATKRHDVRLAVLSGAATWGLVALSLTWSEHRFFDAADAAAEAVVLAHPEGGAFTGEWSYRHRMMLSGWSFSPTLADLADLPSGTVVAVPEHSSPGPVPDGWQRLQTRAYGWGPLRVVHAAEGVGWYGDSLGVVPFSWSPGPLEQVTTWRVP